MMKNSFYITLPSNVTGPKLFEKNTLSNYITRLGQNLNLIDFEVGLAEISYTNSWFNVTENQLICLTDGDGNLHSNGTNIKAGRYDDQQELIDLVNKRLHTYKSIKIPVVPFLEMDKHSRRITVTAGIDGRDGGCYVVLPPELQNMLGFAEKYFDARFSYRSYTTADAVQNVQVQVNQKSIKGDIEAFHAYDINAGLHSLYVYCDIIDPSFVGDTYAQLLRVVEIPNRSKFGDQCIIRYEKPYYFSLNTRSFQTIEIDIKDDAGAQIGFKFGRTRIVLHFRKRDGSVR